MKINFEKFTNGLVPCIVQDVFTLKVLMLGYMNEAALESTLRLKKVTFYSRRKQRLWTKGETSGHFLWLNNILFDCDEDCILVKATPHGAVCHKGTDTCFNEINQPHRFIDALEGIIAHRKNIPGNYSYTASLFSAGIHKIAQKVGEEAVETILEAKDNNDVLFKNEAADLLFHYLVLLQAKGFTLSDIEQVLKQRHKE